MTPTTPSSQELIADLRAQGMSYSHIGRQLGRDSSLIGQIAAGKKPGTNLTAALTELATTGTITHPPQRRTSRAGGLARVRGGKANQGESVYPTAPPGQRVPTATPSTAQPRPIPTTTPSGVRNRFKHTPHYMPGGRELHQVTAPIRKSAETRKAGNQILAGIIDHAQAAGKRFTATVYAQITRNGRTERIPVTIGGKGGYSAQNAADAVRSYNGDVLEWLDSQIQGRYPEFEGGFVVVGATVDIW